VAGVTTNFAYDDQGRLCAVGASDCSSPNVTYTDAGMTEIIGGWFYRYDSARHLVSACQSTSCTGSGFNRVDFTYDGEGNRTGITDTAAGGVVTTTVFTYQGGVITGETVNGTPTRSYIAAGGTTAEMTIPPGSGAGTYIVVWNGHGDAGSLDLLNADGTLTPVNTFSYSTWGAPTTTVSSGATDLAFRFLYVGSGDVQTDNDFGLGLEYMHARTYSPALGRFLQPDPARINCGYVYATNSPASNVDSKGTGWQRLLRAWRIPTYGIAGVPDEVAHGLETFGGLMAMKIPPVGVVMVLAGFGAYLLAPIHHVPETLEDVIWETSFAFVRITALCLPDGSCFVLAVGSWMKMYRGADSIYGSITRSVFRWQGPFAPYRSQVGFTIIIPWVDPMFILSLG
jgi:RHS repeat-associated protein